MHVSNSPPPVPVKPPAAHDQPPRAANQPPAQKPVHAKPHPHPHTGKHVDETA
jgi:hypothetical protein